MGLLHFFRLSSLNPSALPRAIPPSHTLRTSYFLLRVVVQTTTIRTHRIQFSRDTSRVSLLYLRCRTSSSHFFLAFFFALSPPIASRTLIQSHSCLVHFVALSHFTNMTFHFHNIDRLSERRLRAVCIRDFFIETPIAVVSIRPTRREGRHTFRPWETRLALAVRENVKNQITALFVRLHAPSSRARYTNRSPLAPNPSHPTQLNIQ